MTSATDFADQHPQTQKPSWVGHPLPSRSSTLPPTSSNMTQTVRLSYTSPGLKPPVFVATSLGDRPWEPIQMHHSQKDNGEHDFWQEFDHVEEGEYQYKFRLGPGDWWVLDETKDTVDDGTGNRNNLVVVKPHDNVTEEPNSPLLSHETLAPPNADDHDHEQVHPLFRHESLTPLDTEDHDDADFHPLFRHESLTPLDIHHDDDDDDDGGMSPLFRHESMSPINIRSRSSSRSIRSNSASSYKTHPFSDDVNDPSLEPFPTERDGILAHLHRTSSRVAEDDTALERSPSSSSLASPRIPTIATSPVISMIPKSSNEHLDAINEDEAEELSLEEEQEAAEQPSTQQSTSAPLPDVEHGYNPVVDAKEPTHKLSISPAHEPVNHGPPTPPMTPINELEANNDGNVDESSSSPKAPEAPDTPRARKDNATDHITSRSISKSSSDSPEAKDTITYSLWSWFAKLCGGRVGTVGVAVAVGLAAAFYAITGRNPPQRIRDTNSS